MTNQKNGVALAIEAKSEPTPYVPTLPNMLHYCVKQYGDLHCVIHGEERLTFKDVAERSAELALALLNAGVGKGTRIGLLMQNGADWIVNFLAIARIGAVLIPISTFSQPRELQWVLNHCDAQILLTSDSYLGHDYLARLEEALPELISERDQYLASCPYLRNIF
ncbi:MAG: AMP-binding protein, partial [Desulfobulbia bacterium]